MASETTLDEKDRLIDDVHRKIGNVRLIYDFLLTMIHKFPEYRELNGALNGVDGLLLEIDDVITDYRCNVINPTKNDQA